MDIDISHLHVKIFNMCITLQNRIQLNDLMLKTSTYEFQNYFLTFYRIKENNTKIISVSKVMLNLI